MGDQAANDNVPSWRDANPELAKASAARIAATRNPELASAELEAYRSRIAARQSIGEGWDGAANDNNGWPLAKALLADDKGQLLRYAMAYRRIEASAHSQAQLGGSALGVEPVQVDQRTWVRPDGEIVYTGVRKLTAAGYAEDQPATQKSRTDETTMKAAAPVPKKWNGDDRVNAMLDNQRTLQRIRARLGPLVEPFERLAIDGATLEEVGRELGSGNRAGAMGAAKAMAVMALYVVADALGTIRREDIAA